MKQRNILSGSVFNGILFMAIPIMAMNVFQTLVGIIDMTVLGIMVNDIAVGAVGSSGMLISLTTPVREKDNVSELNKRTDVVINRNKTALKIADEFNIPVIDLFEAVIDREDVYTSDGVHFTQDGYRLIAETIYKRIIEL